MAGGRAFPMQGASGVLHGSLFQIGSLFGLGALLGAKYFARLGLGRHRPSLDY
jgi:hypothetical protein